MRRRVIVLAAFGLWLCVLYAPTIHVMAQTVPFYCEVFVDCTGSGGKVSGQDDLNRRAYVMGHVDTTDIHVPIRRSTNCVAESGGVQDEICIQTGPPRQLYACNTAPCNATNWEKYSEEAPIVLISGVIQHSGPPPALTAVSCTNTNHLNASGTAKTWTLCDPAILQDITSFSSGNTLCFLDNFGAAMTITPQAGHSISLNNGTSVVDKAAGASIVSSGTRGDECCMQAIAPTQWLTRVCKGFS